MKNKIKMIVVFGLGILVSSGVIYAATLYSATEVSYDNTSSGSGMTNVQSAIDELYEKANVPKPTGNATAGDVKEGVTFWNANTSKQEVGSLKEKTLEELQEEKRFYLYKEGNEYTNITGGWTSSEYGGFYATSAQGYTLKPVVKNSDHLLLSTGSVATKSVAGTVNKININGYRRLGIELDFANLSSFVNANAGFSSNKYLDNAYFLQYFSYGPSKRSFISISIPTLSNQDVYIVFSQGYPYQTSAGSLRIYKVWLEK